MSTSQRSYIADRLRDPDYRAAFVEQQIQRSLPAQIRALREERGWSQEELGRRCGKSQEWICRLESPSYGRFTMGTLIDLARAFDVALTARFLPFSALLDWYTSRTTVGNVPSFDKDGAIGGEENGRDVNSRGTRLEVVARGGANTTYSGVQGSTIAA